MGMSQAGWRAEWIGGANSRAGYFAHKSFYGDISWAWISGMHLVGVDLVRVSHRRGPHRYASHGACIL
jgi:hypothetical protein